MEIVNGVAMWYHSGKPPVPIRWVWVRDPQAFLCTNPWATPLTILT